MKNNEKGITLIALIITIIVMLILVAVTVNVALNGGLFEKAREAKEKTQKETEKEELMSAAFGTLDNTGKLQMTKTVLEGALSNGWDVDDEHTIVDNINNEEWYVCTTPNGATLYLNTKTGEIREEEPATIGQVQGLEVGDIILYDEEQWVVAYNDSTYGLQIVRKAPVLNTSNFSGKAGYNSLVKNLNFQCQSYKKQNLGAVSARCFGGDPNYEAYKNSTDADGYKVATALIDGVPEDFYALAAVGEQLDSSGIAKILLPWRAISDQEIFKVYLVLYIDFVNLDDKGEPNIDNILLDYKINGTNGDGGNELTEMLEDALGSIEDSDNYYIIPCVTLKANGFNLITSEGRDGTAEHPYEYSY